MKPIRAWYFSDETRKLRYGDGRTIAIGIEHTVSGYPDLGQNGLHGAEQIIEALNYAPGPVVWLVELSGRIKRADDKLAATRRKYIAGGIDISDILRRFARAEALLVADKWDCPEVMRRWLETGDESIRSAALLSVEAGTDSNAESYARSAARSTARSTALSAALSTASSAAWSAAWVFTLSPALPPASSSVRSPALSPAWSAAQSSAWLYAWSNANKMLETMVMEVIK